MWRRSARRLGNIDVTYVRNNECDDFAELERFFARPGSAGAQSDHLGWMLAIRRLARSKAGGCCLAALIGNGTISWYGWSQAVDHLRGDG